MLKKLRQTTLLSLGILAALAIWPTPAHAKNENFAFVDNKTIQVSSPDLVGNLVELTGSTHANQAGSLGEYGNGQFFEVVNQNGCTVEILVVIRPQDKMDAFFTGKGAKPCNAGIVANVFPAITGIGLVNPGNVTKPGFTYKTPDTVDMTSPLLDSSPVELTKSAVAALVYEAKNVKVKGRNCTINVTLSIRAQPERGDAIYSKGSSNGCSAAEVSSLFPNQANVLIGNVTASGQSASGGSPDCESSGAFGWIYCGVFEGVQESAEFIEGMIQDFLEVQPLRTTANDTIYQVWKQFRNLANAGFVVVFLVFIFANVFNGIVPFNIDPYSVKKILPRLVAASILVQFSYVLVSLGVDIANILGAGIKSLIDPVLTSARGAGGNVAGLLSGGGLLVASVALIAGIVNGTVILALIAAFFAILAVFFTLIVRQALITLLIIISPIAFMAWVLPNTEGLFKTWSKTFVRVLMMYPMIILLFAAGDIFGMATTITGGKNVVGDQVKAVTSLLAQIVPLFMVPATFAFAGKAMTAIAGLAGGLAARGARGAKDSQFSKDFLQARKEKNLLRSQSESKAARTFGKLGAGGAMPTAASKRRLAAGYAGVLESQGKDLEELFTNADFRKDDFRAIAGMENGKVYEKTAPDGTKTKVKVNDAAKYKALSKMADFRDFDGLRDKKTTMGKSAPWRQAMAKNVGDIIKGAPDLIQGDDAFKTLSADQMAGFHHSTINAMVKSLEGAPAAQRERTYRTINQVMDSPALSGRVSNESWGHIRRAADKGIFSGIPSVDPSKDAAEYLKDAIHDGGPSGDPVKDADEWGTLKLGFLERKSKDGGSGGSGGGSTPPAGGGGSGVVPTGAGDISDIPPEDFNPDDPKTPPTPPSGPPAGPSSPPSGGGSPTPTAPGSGGSSGPAVASSPVPPGFTLNEKGMYVPNDDDYSEGPDGSWNAHYGPSPSSPKTTEPGTAPVTEVGPTEPATRFTVGPDGQATDQTPRFTVGPSGVTADRENPSPLTADSGKPRPGQDYFTVNDSGGRVPLTETAAKKAAQKGDDVYPISELDKPRPKRAEGPGFVRRGVQGTVGGIGDIAKGIADISDQAVRVTKNAATGSAHLAKAKVEMAKGDAAATAASAQTPTGVAPTQVNPSSPSSDSGYSFPASDTGSTGAFSGNAYTPTPIPASMPSPSYFDPGGPKIGNPNKNVHTDIQPPKTVDSTPGMPDLSFFYRDEHSNPVPITAEKADELKLKGEQVWPISEINQPPKGL